MVTYYTPAIEDLHVGYECEWSSDDKDWEKVTSFGEGDLATHLTYEERSIRTPYLTKDQIERDGWVYRPDSFLAKLGHEPDHWWFTKNGFGLTLYSERRVQITDDRQDTTFPNFVFTGVIQSINELRMLSKILGI